jgi:VanZ family protein
MRTGETRPMTRQRVYFLLLVGWVLVTFVLTSIPSPDIKIRVRHADKMAHLSAYAVMGFLCARWRRERGDSQGRVALYALGFVALVGAVDEIHQLWIPGRSAEFADWLADVAGGAIGIALSAYLPAVLASLHTD